MKRSWSSVDVTTVEEVDCSIAFTTLGVDSELAIEHYRGHERKKMSGDRRKLGLKKR
jgi:hypothetical protein